LPVQSGSNRILEKMNRRYTTEHYLNTLKLIRKHIKDATISSDFIVGFATETEQEFIKTVELVEKARFDNIFAYMYSVRSGTAAEKYEGHIDLKIKNERVNKLLSVQKKIAISKKNEMVGKTLSVISQKHKNENETITRADSGRTIIIKEKLELNKFYNAIVTEIKGRDIIAKLIS
jgi:tRNA-2-methylthio-N6-dimethylallyladenosine synthase